MNKNTKKLIVRLKNYIISSNYGKYCYINTLPVKYYGGVL
jgi:hypothetical protein